MARLRAIGENYDEGDMGDQGNFQPPAPPIDPAMLSLDTRDNPFAVGGEQEGALGDAGEPTSGGAARSGETPRERGDVQLRALGGGMGAGGGEGTAQASPARPRTPQPMAGSSFTAPSGGATGLVPFQPMGSPDVGSMVTPQSGLYGGAGGLKGGGLGVPLDPTSNQQSNPLDMLLELLSKSR